MSAPKTPDPEPSFIVSLFSLSRGLFTAIAAQFAWEVADFNPIDHSIPRVGLGGCTNRQTDIGVSFGKLNQAAQFARLIIGLTV